LGKLSNGQIMQIREMKSRGIKNKVIVKKFNISNSTVVYWTNSKSRKKSLQRAIKHSKRYREEGIDWASRNPEKYREYMQKYIMRRYNSEPEFRRKYIERMKEYNMRKKNGS